MLWEVEELQKISNFQPELVSQALGNLWKSYPELYKDVVLNAYLDEKINLSKAAELLLITRNELSQELRVKGVPQRNLSKIDVNTEVESIQEW